MSAQSVDLDGPLIPMPELTPDAPRAAVAQIAPSGIPALTQHLFEATTNAQRVQSLAPLRARAELAALGPDTAKVGRPVDREGGPREFDILGGRGFLSFLAVPRQQRVYVRNTTWLE